MKATESRFDLVLASFLFLFFEFAVLRWIPSYVRIIAYFSNVLLISCFVGFGLGCILKKSRDIFGYFPALFLAELCATRFFSQVGVENPFGAQELFFTTSAGLNWYFVIPALFALNALLFASLGQRLARELDRFAPLQGYTLNVLGSLAGAAAFAAGSFLGLRPTAWFALCSMAALWLLRARPRKTLALALAALTAGCALVRQKEILSIWSPYNKINVFPYPSAPGTGSFSLAANNDLHQVALSLSGPAADRVQDLRQWRDVYDFPYRILGRRPERVLVLGAGTGNDVAAALRNGAGRVDAVELDPRIAELGRRWHPDRPYADPRVRLHIDDARRYLRAAPGGYDMVVLGWLDSHRLFSSMSNVRQDNFVYTRESMEAVRAQLKDDGLLCLSFFAGKPWVGSKLFNMLSAAFGHAPRVYAYEPGTYGRDGQMFVIGREPLAAAAALRPGFVDLTDQVARESGADVPTDDWPFLYYKSRALTPEYGWTLALLLAVSCLLVLPAVRGGRSREPAGAVFFLLGAGFMLLEARNVTALALVYGSTWLVTSAVVCSILVMILAANALVERRWVPARRLTWSFLLASVLLVLYVRPRLDRPALDALATTLLASLTFLFAGIIFAETFQEARQPSAALGWNVLGAVFGGLAEYLCLIVGMRALLWIALALYAAAWGLSEVLKRGSSMLPGHHGEAAACLSRRG